MQSTSESTLDANTFPADCCVFLVMVYHQSIQTPSRYRRRPLTTHRRNLACSSPLRLSDSLHAHSTFPRNHFLICCRKIFEFPYTFLGAHFSDKNLLIKINPLLANEVALLKILRHFKSYNINQRHVKRKIIFKL